MSFETVSNSSGESETESETESGSHSEDEKITMSISSKGDPGCLRQHPAHAVNVSKQSVRSESSDKVRNTKNTTQEKENLGTQNIFQQKETKGKSEETKQLVLKKLQVLNKSNVAASRGLSHSKQSPNCSSGAVTSDDGDTSSGGQEVRRIISNDAVARRHQANLSRQQLNKEMEEKNDQGKTHIKF